MKQLLSIILVLNSFVLIAQNQYTRVISKDRVISSYHIEVTYDKTVHILFPSAITYIDLGSSNIIAGKADGAENVVRVKASVRDFKDETNFSVITDEGSFYSFIVNYSDKPTKLNIEMKDFLHEHKLGNQPENSMEIFLSDLGNATPQIIELAMGKIYKTKRKQIKNINSKQFGIEFSLNGIYSQDGLLYFQVELENTSDIPFEIDFLTFKIVDKKVAKRTAIQETIIKPVWAFNYLTSIDGNSVESSVFAFESFTIPDKKQLVMELFEKNGGRHQRFVVRNGDLIKAKPVKDL
ncbi:Bacteroides conjugative transposon TraN protein [Mariniphaga anaerophila]|uniref:Bacteroides conjugative transposon TraN protein n=1 Tax=Mariniphaga anaerophila TaxID=1484053 RepID=A0A1M4U3K5_9BACT|nr:conjugative transposon protein TraN [Mariniphaga anaerophila]SHE51391.1 Bacteroides conjugative transposon TraN protein [Mariniphaga anaerophila]